MKASSVRVLDYETSERLHEAVVRGDLATLTRFSSDVRAWSGKGVPGGHQSLLGYAAHRGKSPVVDLLLRLGCDPNEPLWRSSGLYELKYGLYADTPLVHAVGSHSKDGAPDLENARLLLAHGALVDGHPSAPDSPLTWAAICGNLAAVKLLVEAGADPYWEGWRYGAALDEALHAGVIGTGQDKTAEYLRSVGATVTYLDWHNWQDRQLECIERTLGVVNPRPIERRFGETAVSVYKSRFAPRKFLNRLLFTRGLAPFLDAELGVVVSYLWPLNKGALPEARFNWPIELLFHLAAGVVGGARLAHGSVLREMDEILRGFSTPVSEWLIAKSGQLEQDRAFGGWTGAVPVLLLTPMLTKKRYKPGKEALTEADKRSAWKWERLHLPLPDLTPAGYEYLRQLDEPSVGSAG
jgi:hypothetical protein